MQIAVKSNFPNQSTASQISIDLIFNTNRECNQCARVNRVSSTVFISSAAATKKPDRLFSYFRFSRILDFTSDSFDKIVACAQFRCVQLHAFRAGKSMSSMTRAMEPEKTQKVDKRCMILRFTSNSVICPRMKRHLLG